jgi:sulfite reductase beta subunit-like hemoprotein
MPAVDLSIVAADAKREAERDTAIEQVRQEQQMLQLTAQAREWDRAMNRAFKGIMPRPTRHAMMKRAADRER